MRGNKSFGSYLSLSKKRLILSWETSPNIFTNLLYPPNLGYESKNKVYSSLLHSAVEVLLTAFFRYSNPNHSDKFVGVVPRVPTPYLSGQPRGDCPYNNYANHLGLL
jgi:hypothetical protein